MALTGKLRHRVKGGWFGGHTLVLQVEESRADLCKITFSESPSYRSWRDATYEDIQSMNHFTIGIESAAERESAKEGN